MADRHLRAVSKPVRETREAVGANIAAMMDGDGEAIPLRRKS